jgi:dihydrofolate synthase / folylpolyglutamate synthase
MTADERARLAEIERSILGRRPERNIDPTLDRISALANLLGDPQKAYPVIHLTGTNGKTSTARMTERLLRARGLRTGLFTSPHLSSFQERICIDGEPLSTEAFIAAYDEIEPYLGLVDASQASRLSFFEVLVGMAFATFADAPVDVAVIEVGVGGGWDNTNIADGAVAVITPIAIDHARWLGSTVAEIAAEKAGIIKPGAIAVIAQQPPAAAEVLLRRSAEAGATVAREGLEFGVLSRELAVGGQRVSVRGLLGDYEDLFLPLFGAHQAGNLACALAAVEAFARPDPTGTPLTTENGTAAPVPALYPARSGAGPDEAGVTGHDLDEHGLDEHGLDEHGLGEHGPAGPLDIGLVRGAVATMTSPGRLEIVRRSPLVLVDAAHNPAGMAATVAAVEEAFRHTDLIVIAAISADKDVAGILDELEPVTTRLIATGNVSGRAMEPDDLADAARAVLGPDRVSVAARLDEAIEMAVTLADEADAAGDPGGAVVLITGSVYTAGEARLLLARGGTAARVPGSGRTAGGDLS